MKDTKYSEEGEGSAAGGGVDDTELEANNSHNAPFFLLIIVSGFEFLPVDESQ